jgi:hypothetical protein
MKMFWNRTPYRARQELSESGRKKLFIVRQLGGDGQKKIDGQKKSLRTLVCMSACYSLYVLYYYTRVHTYSTYLLVFTLENQR